MTPPDYRFSLANERTFLSWMRTSLGLIAGGIALTQLVPDNSVGWLRDAIGVLLVLVGGVSAGQAYYRWRRVEQAMRNGEPLPDSVPLQVIAIVIALIALAAVGVLIAQWT